MLQGNRNWWCADQLNAVCQADAWANAAGAIAAGSGEPMLRCWLLAAAKSVSWTTPAAWSAPARLPEPVTVAVPRGRAQPDWHMRCKGVFCCWCVVSRLSAGCFRGGHCRVLVFVAVLAASRRRVNQSPRGDGGDRCGEDVLWWVR